MFGFDDRPTGIQPRETLEMRLLLLTLLFFAGSFSVFAQHFRTKIHYKVALGDTTQVHELILQDYSKLIGLAKSTRGGILTYRVHGATEDSYLPIKAMRYLGVYEQLDRKAGKGAEGPAFSDLTYERTALPLSGKGQFRIINLIYYVAEFNLSEYVQVGAGLAGPLGILLTQRVRTSITPNIHIGLSNQFLYPPLVRGFDNDQVYVGDVTGILTIGDQRRFLNLGTGIFYGNDNTDTRIWVHRMAVGGRLNSKLHAYVEAAVSQNNTFSDLTLFPSATIAYGERRHRWQFGVFTVFQDGENYFPPPIPYVGYALYW